PFSHKLSVIYGMVHRACKLCSSANLLNMELDTIFKILKCNDYPTPLIKKQINLAKTKFLTPKPSQPKSGKSTQYVTLPYIKDFTDKSIQLFKQYDIKVALIPGSKLKSSLSGNTTVVDPVKQSNIVYRIPCSDCDRCYVGMSQRSFGVRVKEHANSVRYNDLSYATAAHVINEGHTMNFDQARIIDRCNNYNQLVYLESTHIISNKVINGNTAWRSTNLMWLPFLSK
ncbi:MAG TPA: hypothetical protein VKR58_07055, partial [Aquella sp.]|nr:hypothetical protein [Aquella sp.]